MAQMMANPSYLDSYGLELATGVIGLSQTPVLPIVPSYAADFTRPAAVLGRRCRYE